MSDDLRTRIADVVYDNGDYDYQHCRKVADAVIEELEAGYVLVPKNVTLVQWDSLMLKLALQLTPKSLVCHRMDNR